MGISQADTRLSTSWESRETMPLSPRLVDTTLRDGEQTPGVSFSKHEKLAILEALINLGLHDIEAGIPAMGREEQSEIREMVRLSRPAGVRLIPWARAVTADIHACAQANTSAIHIALPTSDVQMRCIGKTGDEVLDALAAALSVARPLFDFVSIGAQDATRADQTFLDDYVERAVAGGADRVRLSDTVGIGDPIRIYRTFSRYTSRFPNNEWEFHGHNDFGMATANTVMALQAGATCASVTVLGLGERAGNAPLESVVMAAGQLCHIDFEVNRAKLFGLCEMVADFSGRAIPMCQPVVGDAVLRHESGIHTHGQLRHPLGFQPFEAREVGRREAEFVYGKHTGRASVKALLKRYMTDVTPDHIDRVTRWIHEESKRNRRGFTESEIVQRAPLLRKGKRYQSPLTQNRMGTGSSSNPISR